MASNHPDATMQAKGIVRYETQEKGFLGNLLGIESRDGGLSQIFKALSVGSGAWALAVPAAALASGPTSVALGAAGGLAGGALSRYATQSFLSDMHDSRESFGGKLGHYVTGSLTGGAMLLPLYFLSPSLFASPLAGGALLLAASSAAASIAGGKIARSLVGNPELVKVSEDARAIAKTAMDRGISVEQVVAEQDKQQSKAAEPVERSNEYHNSVTPEEFQQMESKMSQRDGVETSFAQKMNPNKAAEKHAEAAASV
jgi:hypothetical protein